MFHTVKQHCVEGITVPLTSLAGPVALGAAALGALALYSLIEPRLPLLRRADVPVAGLDPALAGLTIGQISDIHLGPFLSQAGLQRGLDLLIRERTDLIVLTGDFVSSPAAADRLGVLSQLKAPLGVYAVLGNHDYRAGGQRVVKSLSQAGVTVLRNEHRRLERGGAPIWLIGLDDALYRRHNLAQATAGLPTEGLRLLLVHEPDVADQVSPVRIDLQLSGHTHAGQVRLPLINRLVLPPLGRKYVEGLRRVDPAGAPAWLYVNRGYGCVFLPVRFACRPEVTVLRITPHRSET